MRLSASEEPTEGLNLTSVIDVVFLLLIFFLVATRFDQEERELTIDMAEVPEAQPLSMPPNEVIVNVDAGGNYQVAGEVLSESALGELLHRLSVRNPGTQSVQIRVDRRTAFQYPAAAASLCAREGLRYRCSVRQQYERGS